MIIHISHTKETLVKIIRVLDFPIKYSNQLKTTISENLSHYCEENSKMLFKPNGFNFKNMNDLISYLQENSNNSKNLISVKEREKLIKIARQIISYINCGCDYELSIFNNETELHNNIIYVCKYGGSLSTCRRSIKMLNDTLPPHKQYEMDIDPETQTQIEQREMKKYLRIPKFNVKQKKVALYFD